MTTVTAPENLRPLPSRPSLEFERKRAKQLLRTSGGTLKLAEAQLQVAREYGFASWRKLLAYYKTWELHKRTGTNRFSEIETLDRAVRQIILEFNNRKAFNTQPPDVIATGASIASFIPRFYGLSDAEIFTGTLTESEAQLIVARRAMFSTWGECRASALALAERRARRAGAEVASTGQKCDASAGVDADGRSVSGSGERASGSNGNTTGNSDAPTSDAGRSAASGSDARARTRADSQTDAETSAQRATHPMMLVRNAILENDREALQQLFKQHPEWFEAPEKNAHHESWVLNEAMTGLHNGTPQARENFDWIASLMAGLQQHLNIALLGGMAPGRTPVVVQALLDHGADPRWQPANGYSVLEHAIVRYKCGPAVDLVATRATPPKSFWVAAALGDVPTMCRFVNKRGVLTASARRHLPDLRVLDSITLGGAVRPDAPDRELVWEVFMLAVMNGRTNTLETLLDRGFPVDYSPVWFNALHVAIDQGDEAVVRLLLTRGANPDFKAWPDQRSPRELSESLLEHQSDKSAANNIRALLSGATAA